MKLSVSLPDEDVALLDAYAEERGLPSRSAALRDALRLLRNVDLEEAYDAAWHEWQTSGEAEAWDRVVGNGLT